MKLFERVLAALNKSYQDFVEEVNPYEYQWKNLEAGRETSVKNINPTTYDRYDAKYGLHAEPKIEE